MSINILPSEGSDVARFDEIDKPTKHALFRGEQGLPCPTCQQPDRWSTERDMYACANVNRCMRAKAFVEFKKRTKAVTYDTSEFHRPIDRPDSTPEKPAPQAGARVPAPKPPSQWTVDDYDARFRSIRERMRETGEALLKAESLFRKLDASEKPLLAMLYVEVRQKNAGATNALLEKLALAHADYKTFLIGEKGKWQDGGIVGGLAHARSNWVKARHAHEMASADFESLRSIGAMLREERRAGG